jgi:multiple sugar transport system permease protein
MIGRQTNRWRALWARLRRRSQIGLNITILFLLALALVPTFLMISVSFKNELQYRYQTWTLSFPLRIGNYRAAWEIVESYIWNTTFVAIVGLLGVLLLSLIGGYVFARMRFPFRESLYYAMISLLMVPWALTFIPSYMVYYRLGLLDTRWALIVPNLASGPVFGVFLMRAIVAGIPEEVYEAARCDGASVFREIASITFPLSLPGLATLAVLNFIGTWNSFLWPLTVITERARQVISVGLYMLRVGSGTANWGPLFASYVIASLPLVAIFAFLGKFYVEGLVESGLKV